MVVLAAPAWTASSTSTVYHPVLQSSVPLCDLFFANDSIANVVEADVNVEARKDEGRWRIKMILDRQNNKEP